MAELELEIRISGEWPWYGRALIGLARLSVKFAALCVRLAARTMRIKISESAGLTE